MLTALAEGGLQYLMAGARCNIGLKTGRYMFEVKILEKSTFHEDPTARSRMMGARSVLRIGLSTAKSSLILGETEDSVCFDSEGFFRDRRKASPVCSSKFTTGDVVTLVANLDPNSKFGNTLSVFKDGQRVAPPQQIPEHLQGKVLYPGVSFRNMALHYNFGASLMPLPFKCRFLKDASQKDVSIKAAVKPTDGQYEVIFPIAVPDEGGFDWLDHFLESHPGYTELSDRAMLSWCEQSGLSRPKGYAATSRASNDKPEMGFGVSALDDGSMRRTLQALVSIQPRHFIVMEVKAGLLKEDRSDLALRWGGYQRIATVVVGEPPVAFKEYSQERIFKAKQEAKLAGAKSKGTPEEEIPAVELTAEEKKLTFRRLPVSDLTAYVLNTNFQKFSLPDEQETYFEDIQYVWSPEKKAKQHLEEWIQVKKLTSRLEDLQPGEWFSTKWKEWQKVVQSYQTKHNIYKAAEAKKSAQLAAKEQAEKDGTELPLEALAALDESDKVDFDSLDVFGVEDVMDVGGGEPLFAAFTFEDWTLMSLRYELHLMAHAFRRDSHDPGRISVPVEHLAFYYQKYYKKALNIKFFGVDSCEELVSMVSDTVLITGKSKVLEPQLPDDLESTNLFVMLTEESRRDRNRRIDMGDDSAKLKIVASGQATATPQPRPFATTQIRPQWPQQQPTSYQTRPISPFGQPRPTYQPWEGDGYKGGGYKGGWRNW
ncbi:Hnrnpu [Symbiodinium pilosum]|uniref:Hnrnpu protein n=1 Tax=Symbiodinium pilosum TaxID=2952 RepID=A0A812RZI7_SYMPI|nr:Hnrnpu [Symbiodinium pilosum]